MNKILFYIVTLFLFCIGTSYGQESEYVNDIEVVKDSLKTEQEGDPIYVAVQIKAEPKHGMAIFQKEFFSKFIVPNASYDRKVYSVILEFVVETDGTLTNIKAIRDPGYDLGREAVRVMSEVAKWNPAIQNKVNVRSKFTLPLTVMVDELPPQVIVYKNGVQRFYSGLPLPIMDVEKYCERFIEVFKKSQYYLDDMDYSLRIRLSINERGKVVKAILYKDSIGLEYSLDDLVGNINAISKWRNTQSTVEDVILQISINPSDK